MGIDVSKAKKILSEAYVQNNNDLNEDELNAQIANAMDKIKNLEEERDNDTQLQSAQQIVKDLKSGYSSAIQYEKAKVAFLLDKRREIQEGDINPDSSI